MSRSLQCCPSCARQYDVSALSRGSPVGCSCGVSFAVSPPEAHAPRALCCSRCGGSLRADASSCEYCEAQITLEERRLDSICPACFARMASDAQFCMSCGVRIEVQALAALPASAKCPRCAASLRSRRVGDATLTECSSCAGLWVDPGLLERLCSDAGARKSVAEMLGQVPAPRAAGPAPSQAYVKCPSCSQPMNRKNFGSISGVLIDLCRDHGVWLDHGELERALAFAEKGGLIEARRREVGELERRKQRAESDSLAGGAGWLEAETPAGWGNSRSGWSRRKSTTPIGGLLGWLASELLS